MYKKTVFKNPINQIYFKDIIYGDLPDGLVVDYALPMQGAQVGSLMEELRSHMPCSAAKK